MKAYKSRPNPSRKVPGIWRFQRSSALRSKRTRKLRRLLRVSATATRRSMWIGLRRRNAMKPDHNVWQRRLHGWRKENLAIGSTPIAEAKRRQLLWAKETRE